MSRTLNIFILFLITIVCMLFPENIKNNQTLVIKREEFFIKNIRFLSLRY